MGKSRRFGGGGGRREDRLLRRQIVESYGSYPTVEQLVDHLHAKHLHENRQLFTRKVRKIVKGLRRRNNANASNDDSDVLVGVKKRRRIDNDENDEKVGASTRRCRLSYDSSGGSSSSLATDTSLEGDGSSDEETSVSSLASTSSSEGDDLSSSMKTADYGDKSRPHFDLLQSLLRENLSGKSKKSQERRKVKDVNKNNNNNTNDLNIGSGDTSTEIKKSPNFGDLKGITEIIKKLMKDVIQPFHHQKSVGVKPITGVLLHGPPGCGKTTLAQAIANETGVPFYKISAAELVSGVAGASEENIRELFSKANRTAPSVVFIDEIDAIASKRENLRGMELRIVTQLITCMDESCKLVKPVDNNAGPRSSYCKPVYVLVIGATNRPDAVDTALRRPGRFDREFFLGVPDEYARIQILSKLLCNCNCKVEGALDLVKLARSTPGFVGADLKELCDEAGRLALNRTMDKRIVELSREQKDGIHSEDYWEPPMSDEEIENHRITMADLEEAVKLVQPSSKREGFSTIPNVKWEDVGGLHLLKEEFYFNIIRRIKFPEDYEDFTGKLETGFLLYGPPGCGKTLIAKAVANEAGADFIHIKGPELLKKYVGDSELAVRTLFHRARTCSPCIIFFDEVDALTTKHDREGAWIVERLLKQLQIELDGGEERKSVYVIGATNRPEFMDAPVLRQGRFGKLMYVPLPSPHERGMILKALARNQPVDANVDLMALGKSIACKNFRGADLSALMNEAARDAFEEKLALKDKLRAAGRSCNNILWSIKNIHFKRALKNIFPSASDEQVQHYKLLSKSLRRRPE